MTKKINYLAKFIGMVTIVFFLLSCSKTTKSYYHPDFTIGLDSISKMSSSFLKCENVRINGIKKKTVYGFLSKEKITTVLLINILNCSNLPSSNKEQNVLAKKIASLFKHSLKNKNDFNEYVVSFLKHNENDLGAINISLKFYINSAEL